MAEATVNSGGMTRREFLYYIWGASMALFAAEFTGLFIWYLIPKFREGEFGGNFSVTLDNVPGINEPPVNFPDGRFWLVNLDTAASDGQERMYLASDESGTIKGIAAIYKVCTHLGCIYAWNPASQRFECPCHGSKYRLDGRRVESPAPRSLDRFQIIALDANGQEIASSPENSNLDFFDPLVLPENTDKILVNTGNRKKGPSLTLLCEFAGNCP